MQNRKRRDPPQGLQCNDILAPLALPLREWSREVAQSGRHCLGLALSLFGSFLFTLRRD